LFRFFPGYEGCILKEQTKEENGSSNKQYVAFASFADRSSAVYALKMLKDLKFDPASPQVMRVEFAKSNSKKTFLSTPGELFIPKPKKRMTFDPSFFQTMSYNPFMGSYGVNPMMNPLQSPLSMMNPGNPPTNSTVRSPSKQPSNILYVNNFHPDVSERDLIRVFELQPGYQKLVMHKTGLPFSFVYYDDIQNATKAMDTLQGFLIGPTPIRIEYARDKKNNNKRSVKEESPDNDVKPT